MPTFLRSTAPPRWLPFFALVPAGVYWAVESYLLDGAGFPLDDSWIHLQFARNLAHGAGLSYNADQLVTGSTAPLWTALLSLLFVLPGSVVLWAKVMGVGMHMATVDAVFRLLRELRVDRSLAVAGAGLTAMTSWLVWSAMAAMEVGLFCWLSTWGVLLHLRERRDPTRLPRSLPIFLLSTLVRPEGWLLVVLAVCDRLLIIEGGEQGLSLRLGSISRAVQGLAIGSLVTMPMVAFYWLVGGSPLPTTFATKAGYRSGGLPTGQFLDSVQGILFQAQPVVTLLAPAGALAVLAWLGTRQGVGLLLPLWVPGLPIAYGALSSDRLLVGNFGRYFFILFPSLIVLAVLGWSEATRRLPDGLSIGRVRLRWKAWLGLLLLLPTVAAMARGVGLYSRSLLNVEDSDVRMARELALVLPPEAVLAVNDIGALGFLLPNRLVDLAGIITPEVHDYSRRSFAASGSYHPGVLEFIHHEKPDYLIVFPRWFPLVERSDDFVPLLRLKIEDNITMGGDELVLYSTPWTRYPLASPAAEGDPR